MQTRRAQKPITIRSDRAYERLRILTRDGRSQAQVVEEALDRLAETAVPTDDLTERMARIRRIQADFARTPSITMAEFDAREYDTDGNPR